MTYRGDYKVRLTADATGMKAGVNAAKGELNSIAATASELSGKLGGIFAGVSIGAFAGKLVAVQREFDVLNSSLITVTGSSSAAAREMAWIKEFAATTPYALNEVTQAFIRMKSLGLDATEDALRSYGNTASAMGKSLDQMIEAVADASTGEFERLKEFGIKAKKEGEQVSLTFRGLTTTIGNSADEITSYLRQIGENEFAGAMAERAKTLDGAISNLGDSWDELFRTINDAGVGALIYDSVKLATEGIQGLINNINALRSYWQTTSQQQVDMLVTERQRWESSLSRASPGSFQAIKAKEAIAEINGEIRALQESFEKQAYVASQSAATTASAVKPVATQLAGTKKAAKEAKDEIADLIAKLEAKEIEEAAKAVQAYNDAWADYLNGLDQNARALDQQIEQYGMTEAQIAQVTLRRAEERLEMAKMSDGVAPDYLAALEREVELRRQIAGSAGKLEAMEANKSAAEQAAQDWQRTADAIEDALIDALMEGGKSGKEYIESLFRTMVLRPIVQAIVQPIAGSITSAMGVGAPGRAGSGSSGGFGMPGVPGMDMMGMAANGLSWLGGATGLTGLSSFAAGMGMTSYTSAAAMTGLAEAGLVSGVTSGAAASAGSVLGSVSTAMPYIGAALFVAQALGLFNKKPSDKTSWATYDPSTGRAFDIGDMGGKKAASQEQKDATTALAMLTGGFADLVGIDASVTAMMGGRDGTRLKINRDEGTHGFLTPLGTVANGNNSMNFGSGEDAIKLMLDDLIDEGTLPQETIDRWKAAKNNIDGTARDAVELVDVLALINRGLSDTEIVRADLIQAEGEALSVAADRIKGVTDALSPLTADETWTKATRDLADAFADVGQTMPRTLGEFDKLINSLDVTTDAGKDAYQAIFSLAPAFLTLSQAVDQVFASISKTTAESVRDIEMAVLDNAGKYVYLDNEIDGLLEKLNASTDPATIQGLFEQINSKTTQQFNLLDDTEQKRLATEFIDRLYDAESVAQSRLSVFPLDYQPQIDASKAQQAAAEKQSEAADAQIQAANAITEAARLIADAAARIGSGGDTEALAGLTNVLASLRPAEVGY